MEDGLEQKAMVFHYPVDNKPGYRSGSTLRPERMRDAFRDIGYDVCNLTGSSTNRARMAAVVRRSVEERDYRLRFAYMETPNIPVALGDRDHLPRRPFLDFGFLRFLREHGVPVGVFIRDIDWCLDVYRTAVPWWYYVVTLKLFGSDLNQIAKVSDVVFVPSIKMLDYMPDSFRPRVVRELPPGTLVSLNSTRQCDHGAFSIIYVGSIMPPEHDISPLLGAICRLRAQNGIRLTVCCYERERDVAFAYYAKKGYALNQMQGVEVVHEWGVGLEALYHRADVSAMLTQSHDFTRIAMPIKVFESLGFGVPVIANRATPYGSFLDRTGMGWSIEPTIDSAVQAICRLRDEPDRLQRARASILKNIADHRWVARARYVENVLTVESKRA